MHTHGCVDRINAKFTASICKAETTRVVRFLYNHLGGRMQHDHQGGRYPEMDTMNEIITVVTALICLQDHQCGLPHMSRTDATNSRVMLV